MKPHAAVSSSPAGQALCQQPNSSAAGHEQLKLLCKYDDGHAKPDNAGQLLMQLLGLSRNSHQNSTV